MIQVLNQLG